MMDIDFGGALIGLLIVGVLLGAMLVAAILFLVWWLGWAVGLSIVGGVVLLAIAGLAGYMIGSNL